MEAFLYWLQVFVMWCRANPTLVVMFSMGVTFLITCRYIGRLISDRKYGASVHEVISFALLTHLVMYIWDLMVRSME